MPTILHVGLDSLVEVISQPNSTEKYTWLARSGSELTPAELEGADLVLIGRQEGHPIELVQQIYAQDKQISILILAERGTISSLKQALQFAPFVGKNALCIPDSPGLVLAPILANAIQRTRQKRSFNRQTPARPELTQALTSQTIALAQLESFFNRVPTGLLLVDEQNQILLMNPVARTLFGISPTAPAQHRLLSAPFIQQLRLRDYSKEPPLPIVVGEFVLDILTAPIASEESTPYTILVISDITQRQQEQHRLQTILESLPQLAWTTDAEGTFTHVTQSWLTYTGQSLLGALTLGWEAVIHPQDLPVLLTRWQASIRAKTRFQQAARHLRVDGEYRWHLLRADPLRTTAKTVSLWVGSSTDIHDQVMRNEELEARVADRTKLLEETVAELRQYAHISSHDLQEPLRKITTFTDIVKQRLAGQLDVSTQTYLDKIEATATRMRQSLQDLLRFTELANPVPLEPTDLGEVVANVLLDLELVISQKEAVIQLDILPTILGSRTQLQQLFYNLINNALKFSQSGQPPVLTIRVNLLETRPLADPIQLDPDKQYWDIQVVDNGIGFLPEQADKLFTLFYRLHRKNEYAGTGIGLAISKKVVTNHGGAIFAQSTPGQGSTFHVILPAER